MPDLPDVDQQSWTNFSANRWFQNTSDRINSISQFNTSPGSLFLESSNNRIGSLGALGSTIPTPVPMPAPPRPQPQPQPIPQPIPEPTLPEPTLAPVPAPTQPTQPGQVAPPAPPPPLLAPPSPPTPIAPSLPTPPPTLPPRAIQPVPDVPDVPDVPTLGGTTILPKPPSIYAPVTATSQQGPFGGTANGPFAPDTTTPTTRATSTPTPTAPSGAIDATSRSTFASSVAPYAQYAAQQLGIDPTWVAAMMGSESNFGKAPGNELFGVKALPGQKSQSLSTHEGEYGGTTMNQDFAAYDSPQESVDAWVNLIKNHYPGAVNAQDLKSFVHGLKAGGYFTAAEPEYLNILSDIQGQLSANVQGALQAGGQAVQSAANQLTQPSTTTTTTPTQTAMNQSQFGDKQLSTDEAYAACGPAAAVRFAQAYGRNPTLREATDLAKSVGWTSGQGMAGIGSEQQLLVKMGIPTKLVGPDIQMLAHEAQTGNPVTISTPGHYFYADGYNPQTGAFHVGQSGLDLRRGKEWMTPAEMTSLMGPIQGGLLADNPTVTAVSSAAPVADQLDQTRQTLSKVLNPSKPAMPQIPSQQMTQFTASTDPQLQSLDTAVQSSTQPQRSYLDLFKSDQSPWQDLGNTITSAIQRAVSGITGGMGPPGGPPGGGDRNQQRDEDQRQQDQFNPDTGDVGNLDLHNLSNNMLDQLFENPITHEPGAIQQATGLYTRPPSSLEEAANRALADIQRRGIPFPGPGGSISFLQPGRSLRELNPLSKGPDAGALEDILGAVPGILGGGGHTAEDLVNPLRSAVAEAETTTRGGASGIADAFERAAETGSGSATSNVNVTTPSGAGLTRNGLQGAWDSIVRNWFDQNTDLGNLQKDLARRVGPLSDDQRVADLARLDPTHQAESVLEQTLSPSLTKMSQKELDEFDKFVELHTNRSADEGQAKIAEQKALEGGIADSTTRRLDEANRELDRVQQEHAQALADQRAVDAGSGYRTRQSISLDSAGQRVRNAQDDLEQAHENARNAAAAKAHADTLHGPQGELIRRPELRDLTIAESDARRANAAYDRLAARDESIPIAPQGQSNAVRAQYERRLASQARQVGYAEDRVQRMRTAMGENVVSRETSAGQAADAAAARARQTLSQEAQDLLKKVDEGGVPTRMTSNLKRIADEHGIPVTSDTTPNDVVKELRKIRRNPPATPELAGAQVRLRYEQANLDRLQKAKAGGQRILDETLARAHQKVNTAQRDVDVANADLPKYAEAQGWAQLHGRVSRDPYTGDASHYDDVIQRLSELEDKYKGTPTWDKFQEGYKALQDLRTRQLDERVDSGILAPEARDALLDTYDFHTPTNIVDYVSDERPGAGALGRGSSFSVRNNGLDRYTPEGSALEHESHLGATIREVYSHYNALARNRKTNAFVDADNGALRRIADNVDEYVSTGGKSGPLLEPDYKLKGNEQPVVAMVGGKRKEYVTSNPLLKEAIRNNSLGTDNKWINAAKLPAKLVRETAIQRNPKFLPVNLLRDTASAVLKEMTYGGPTLGGKDQAGRWAWDVRPTRGLGSTAVNLGPAALTAATTDPNDPDRGKKVAGALALGMGARAGLNTNLGMGSSAARRFATVFLDNMAGLGTGRMTGAGVHALSEAGGRVGQSDLFRGGGPEATAEALRKLSRPNAFTVRNMGDLRQLADDAALGFVKSFGQRLENIPRQVSFEQAKARGESNVQAALRARDSSVDFDRGGRVARVLNQFIPFFNVGFQAPAQLKRLVEENPLGALYAGMTLLGAPAAAAEAWNRSDPQRAKDYEDDPNYLLNQGIDIMMPGEQPADAQGNRTPQKIHLAIPNEFMPFVTAGREAYNRISGGPTSSAGDLASSLGQELNPLGYGTSVSGVAQTLLPPGLDTALQLQLNHDLFRDSTIANKFSDENASNLGKTLAPLLEQHLTSIPGHETDRVRPSQVDFVIKDVLNGLGQQGLEASDALSGREPRPGDAGNIPLVGGLAGRFVRTTGGQSWEDVRQPQKLLANDLRQKLRSYGDYYEPSAVSSDIQKIPLRREEQVEYQRLTNEYFDKYLRQYSNSSGFARETTRKRMISDAMDRARAMAQSQVLRQIRTSGSSLTARRKSGSSAA